MAHPRMVAALLVATLTSLVTAQQGLLTDGNSQLPACAQSCPVLNQAAAACDSLPTLSQQWTCFCQSGYLPTLATSDAGVCDAYCTNPADSQQVSTWFQSNCGSDHGASEHPDTGAAVSSSATAPAGTSPAAPAATSSSTASSGSSGSSGSSSSDGGSTTSAQSGDWWSTHYKWIVMLIVLAICLPLLASVMIFFKRRHDRKQDQIRGGFNPGITARPAGGPRDAPMSNPNLDGSGPVATPLDGSGRNSPARTREAFMPYGYAYSRSESRLGSRQGVNEQQHRGSPLARGVDAEKEAAGAQEPGKKRSRRVLVRERSTGGDDDIEMEKGPV